ncbi:MAG: tetratricopeptide repeat protein [Phycisphaerales bacterium]|jgi:tetratricopeptide (TPR) repeat protein|nr:tetratricopeptide repeat protein [Phycisphaerales bacterium]
MKTATHNILTLTVAMLTVMVFAGLISGCRGEQDEEAAARAEVKKATEKLTARAKVLISEKKYASAASEIESFLKKYPDAPGSASLWASKIVCHRKDGDMTGALLTSADMTEKFANKGRALCDAGEVLMANGCLPDAASMFELASGDPAVRERACYGVAMSNYRLGRFAKAMQYIDIAAALSPDDPKVMAAVKKIEDARFVNE